MYNETIEVFKETVEKLKKHEKDIESRLNKEEIHLEFISHSKLFPQYHKVMKKEMLDSISLKKIDTYIKMNTSFSNWKELFHVAVEEYIKKNFGF